MTETIGLCRIGLISSSSPSNWGSRPGPRASSLPCPRRVVGRVDQGVLETALEAEMSNLYRGWAHPATLTAR
jgi:hypothetical protein